MDYDLKDDLNASVSEAIDRADAQLQPEEDLSVYDDELLFDEPIVSDADRMNALRDLYGEEIKSGDIDIIENPLAQQIIKSKELSEQAFKAHIKSKTPEQAFMTLAESGQIGVAEMLEETLGYADPDFAAAGQRDLTEYIEEHYGYDDPNMEENIDREVALMRENDINQEKMLDLERDDDMGGLSLYDDDDPFSR